MSSKLKKPTALKKSTPITKQQPVVSTLKRTNSGAITKKNSFSSESLKVETTPDVVNEFKKTDSAKDLEADLSNMNADFHQLSINQSMVEEIKKLRHENEALKSNSKLEDYEELLKVYEAQTSLLSVKQEEWDRLGVFYQSKIDNLELLRSSAITTLQEKVSLLEKEKFDSDYKRAILHDEIKKLKNENFELNKRLEDLRTSSPQLDRLIQLEQSNQQLLRMIEQLNLDHRDQVAILQDKINYFESNNSNEQIDKLKHRIKNDSMLLEMNDAELVDLRNEIATLRTELGNLQDLVILKDALLSQYEGLNLQ